MSLSILCFRLNKPWILFLVGATFGIAGFAAVFPSQPATCTQTKEAGISLAELAPQPSEPYYQPPIEIKASRQLFKDAPPGFEKTYFMPCGKSCHPVARSLRDLGWQKLNEQKNARLIYVGGTVPDDAPERESYQRYNRLHNTTAFTKLNNFWTGMKEYSNKGKKSVYFLPETYRLYEEKERMSFERLIAKAKAKNTPWLQRTGGEIIVLPPTSKTLQTFSPDKLDTTMQRYICDQMVWHGMQFVVRVYWLVASTDPLIVLYQDGFVHIGYNIEDIGHIKKDDDVVSFDAFEDYLQAYTKKNRRLRNKFQDPVVHVRNQFKESLAVVIDAFRDHTFHKPNGAAEDGYSIMASDFVVDEDLNVWLMNTETSSHASDISEDYYFKLEMVHELWYGMISTLQEIWSKQARDVPILPLKTTGKWQLIAAGTEWLFNYKGYERPQKRKSCNVHQNKKTQNRIVSREADDEESGEDAEMATTARPFEDNEGEDNEEDEHIRDMPDDEEVIA